MTAPSRNRSFVSSMLGQTMDDLKTLIRSEMQLATMEVKDNAMSMGRGGGMIAAGALLGLYAFGLLLLAIVELLEEVMPEWLAHVVVGLVIGAMGGVLAIAGRQRIRDAHLVPQQTIESFSDTIDNAIEATGSQDR